MPLETGTRLGPYEITGTLGAGGMGEVYRGRDSRLGREVAIKVIPDELAGDPTRRARFEQEARATAALNAPGIAAVYDVGAECGVAYIVSEFVDGQTLRRLLGDGPPAMRKTLDWAAQIADGLAAAHAAGIIHRDLKPENIMISREGRAKILDFGLARTMRRAMAAGAADTTTRTMHLTADSVVMGTAGYMSPEQVRGDQADARSDIFSLGVVLYEMVSGNRAFAGETSAETMTAILRSEPVELAPAVPPALRQIVDRCLEKPPEARFQSAADLAFALRAVSSGTLASGAAAALTKPKRWKQAVWPAVAMAALAVGAAGTLLVTSDMSGVTPAYRFMPLATDTEVEAFPVFSPDGRSIVYMRAGQVFVRALDSTQPVQLTAGTPNVLRPYWSWDGNRVFYHLNGTLYSVSSVGGTSSKVIEDCWSSTLTPDGRTLVFLRRHGDRAKIWMSSPPGAQPRIVDVDMPEPAIDNALGAIDAFSPDGRKLTVRDVNGALWLVSWPEGKAKRISDVRPSFATWFPDSRHILMNTGMMIAPEGFRLVIFDTEGGVSRTLLQGPETVISGNLNAAGDRLAYSTGAVNFDIFEFDTQGRPLRPLAATARLETGAHWSPSGEEFVYVSNALGPAEIWVRSANLGRSRRIVQSHGDPAFGPSYSPDGRRIVYSSGGTIYVTSAEGGASVPIFRGTHEMEPTWCPDGEHVAVVSGSRLLRIPAAGGEPQLLARRAMGPLSWSPDGRWVVYHQPGEGLRIVAAHGGENRSVVPTTFVRALGDFSRDSRVLYAVRKTAPERGWEIVSAEVETGRLIEVHPLAIDPSYSVYHFAMHPDGRRAVLTVGRFEYDIWMVQDFPRPASGWKRFFRHWQDSELHSAPPPPASLAVRVEQ